MQAKSYAYNWRMSFTATSYHCRSLAEATVMKYIAQGVVNKPISSVPRNTRQLLQHTFTFDGFHRSWAVTTLVNKIWGTNEE